MGKHNKNLPIGWRISVYQSWPGTGYADDRLALGLYRWEGRVTKRLFRRSVTSARWFLKLSGGEYSVVEKDRDELIQYARDTEAAEAKAASGA